MPLRKIALNAVAIFSVLCAGNSAWAQAAGNAKPVPQPPGGDKSSSYYHYALGHLYAELAGAYGNKGDYVTRAVENYRLAIKADPEASFVAEELSDLYVQSGRIREAVVEAEEALRQDPNNLGSRRVLGRIYTRMIGDAQQGKIDESMVKKAVEQYEKIVALAPADLDSWLMLGRLQKIGQNSSEAEKAYNKALELDKDNEDAMTGLAMVYSDLGDTKRATELLRKVADKNPSLRTLTALAGTYEQMREYPLAAETLRRTLELAPGNVEVKRAYAQNLLLSDQVDEAQKLFEQLVEEDPKDAQAFLRLSQIYRQKKDFAKSHEAAEKAKVLEPTSLEVRYNEVNLLEAEDKLPEAMTALREILDSTAKRTYSTGEKSNRVVLLERLAVMHRAEEQYKESIATFQEIGALDAEYAPRAAAQIIETYRLNKEYAKALEEADAASKSYPDDRVIRTARASVLADAGKPEEAVAEIRKNLEGKPDREGYIALAQIYEKTRNHTEMAKAIDAAEKLSSSNEEKESIYFMRGAMLEKLKRFDEAEQEFRKVLTINKENSSALNYLGYMLADRNVRLEEAHQLVQKALELDPNNGAYLDSLGWVFYRMDKLRDAETYLLRAMEKFSKDPTVHDHLGDVYFKQGKIKEAIAQWQNSLQEWQRTPAGENDPAEVAKINKKLESARVRQAKENTVPAPTHQ